MIIDCWATTNSSLPVLNITRASRHPLTALIFFQNCFNDVSDIWCKIFHDLKYLGLFNSLCLCLHCKGLYSSEMVIKMEEEGKCQNRQVREQRREGQADSFKACWCSAVGRANVFRSWPQYILLTEKTNAAGQLGINHTEGRNYYCSCTVPPHNTHLSVSGLKNQSCLDSIFFLCVVKAKICWHFSVAI